MHVEATEELRHGDQSLAGRLIVWVATGFGFGFSPIVPGSCGALWGLPLAWAVQQCTALWLQLVIVTALCGAGVWICGAAARRLGGSDPTCIVWDEIATLPITFFGIPMVDGRWIIAGFVLHRLFDIFKPPPTRRLERLPGGWGIMADDCMAGVYSNIVLHAIGWLGILGAR